MATKIVVVNHWIYDGIEQIDVRADVEVEYDHNGITSCTILDCRYTSDGSEVTLTAKEEKLFCEIASDEIDFEELKKQEVDDEYYEDYDDEDVVFPL